MRRAFARRTIGVERERDIERAGQCIGGQRDNNGAVLRQFGSKHAYESCLLRIGGEIQVVEVGLAFGHGETDGEGGIASAQVN